MFTNRRCIDLTHTITPSIATWDSIGGFDMKILLDYDDSSSPVKFREQHCSMPCGIGTHIDAPSHCVQGGISIADLPLSQLTVKAVVINLSDRATADYLVTQQDVLSFEEEHGVIAENSFPIIYTGWSRFWNTPAAYRNADSHGVLHFPSVAPETADLLLSRGVIGIGIDTLSPDTGRSGFPVHHKFLSAGKYIVENIANADLLPAVGAYVVILPMKIDGATEAPVRMIATVP